MNKDTNRNMALINAYIMDGLGNNFLIIDSHKIRVTTERNIEDISWGEVGAEYIVESTGLFLTQDTASKHIKSGAKKVVMSAPSKDQTPMFVMGVNQFKYNKNMDIVSNASCTTNCLAPIVKVLHENFGVKNGLMTTVHAYTGDQKVHDFPHSDMRRARAAALSMIPTTTGAAVAVSRVLPELEGKLDGMAIRVPTANVSVVDLAIDLEKKATADEVNATLKAAAESSLTGILAYSEEPLVSIDFNGSKLSSVVDGPFTKFIEGGLVKILSWYDNETGYSNRLIELAAQVI